MIILHPLFLTAQEWVLSGPPGNGGKRIVAIPNEPNTVISVLGSSYYPTYPLKTINDGMTWELLYQGLPEYISGPYYRVHDFVSDVAFPDTLFMTRQIGDSTICVFRSVNSGENWQEVYQVDSSGVITVYNGIVYLISKGEGLFRSQDSGDTWENINSSPPSADRLLVDSQNPNRIYVSTYSNGLFYSADSGISFELIGFPDTTIWAFDVISTDTSSLIVVSAGTIGDHQVFFSNDNGQTWVTRVEGLPVETLWGVVNALEISPDNSDIIYAGTAGFGVYKTINKGLLWFPINEGLNLPSYFIQHISGTTLVINTNYPHILYASFAHGLFKTTNGGEEWSLIGIPTTRVTGLSVSPLNPKLVYASTLRGFYVRRDGRWMHTNLWGSGSGISVTSSPVDSNTVIASLEDGIFQGWVYKSEDGGQTWDESYAFNNEILVRDVVFDPMFPERVYCIWTASFGIDYSGLLVSDNAGDTWDLVELDSVGFRGVRSPLAISPTNSDELYLLDISGKVLKSTDRTLTWTPMRSETDTSHYAIAIDPFNTDNIYLGTYSVWKTPDGGETWIRTNLNKWVNDMAFDESSGYLYATTYGGGVFYTTDGGDTWDSLAVPSNPYLDPIDIGEAEGSSVIYAGSVGTGVFEWLQESVSVRFPVYETNRIELFELSQNYPNPFNSETSISFVLPKTSTVNLKVIDILGQSVITLIDNHTLPSGNHTIWWDSKDAQGRTVSAGLYLYEFETYGRKETKKLILLK